MAMLIGKRKSLLDYKAGPVSKAEVGVKEGQLIQNWLPIIERQRR